MKLEQLYDFRPSRFPIWSDFLRNECELNLDNDFIMTVKVPGYDANNVFVELHGSHISVELKDKTKNLHKRWVEYIDTDIYDTDTIKASIKNGLVTVTVKKVTLQEPKKIEIINEN